MQPTEETADPGAERQGLSRRWRRPQALQLPPALQLVLRKILSTAFTLLIASVVLFYAISLSPGDTVTEIVGAHPAPGELSYVRRALGLDEPLAERYWLWLSHALQGQFGNSLIYRGASVASLIGPRLAVTLSLVAYSGILIVVFGLAMGTLGGMVRRSRPALAVINGISVAIPTFFAAEILLSVFAVHFQLFPVTGVGSGFAGRIHSLTLPAFALAVGWYAYVAQVTSAAIREERVRPYVETARGRGQGEAAIFRRHILRGAAIPVLTVSGLSVAGLFAGAIVVEDAFGIGGIGSLLEQAVSDKDQNVVLAISILLVAIFLVVTNTIDLLQVALDPRVRAKQRAS